MVHPDIISQGLSPRTRRIGALNEDDSQQGLVLGLAVGIVSLVILLVIGVAVWRLGVLRAPVKTVAVVLVPGLAAGPALAVTETTTSVVPLAFNATAP